VNGNAWATIGAEPPAETPRAAFPHREAPDVGPPVPEHPCTVGTAPHAPHWIVTVQCARPQALPEHVRAGACDIHLGPVVHRALQLDGRHGPAQVTIAP
jgi:hypothetical protein